MKPYMGGSIRASKAAGEAMMGTRVKAAMALFDRVLAGKPVYIEPPLWQIRVIRRFF